MIRNIRNKIRKNRGFTLVELMIVVAIVGILAALAIYGVTRYMKSAKTAEARNSLGQIAKDAGTAFSREKMAGAVLAGGASTAVSNKLCISAVAKVPTVKASIAGKKYQSSPSEWAGAAADANDVGWKCLKYSMDQPQYFMYGYAATATNPLTDTFSATAEGDLDGDGTLSTFTLRGGVQNGTVAVAPAIEELDPEE